MSLVAHARRELELLGEEAETIDWYCRVIAEFASFGHSGGTAMATIPVLHRLLLFQPLTPLTSDPAEWMDVAEVSGVTNMWQSRRNYEAFSEDGGATYYLLSEIPEGATNQDAPRHESRRG